MEHFLHFRLFPGPWAQKWHFQGTHLCSIFPNGFCKESQVIRLLGLAIIIADLEKPGQQGQAPGGSPAQSRAGSFLGRGPCLRPGALLPLTAALLGSGDVSDLEH